METAAARQPETEDRAQLKFGIFLPTFGPFGDPMVLAELAADAERSGWDGFFVWDHLLGSIVGGGPLADPWISLAAVGLSTSHIRLGTMVTPLARRRPWKLARETVTLDRLTDGRLTLGVGLGAPAEVEFGAFGEETDARARAALLDEGLEIIDRLWSGLPVDHAGDNYRLEGVSFEPRPVQRPRIPIWCAGWWPNRAPFRRAAKWDGVFPELVGGGTPAPADIEEIAAYVAANRADGEGPFDIVIHGRSEPGDPDGARRGYQPAGLTWWLERFGPGRLFDVDEARKRILAGP